MRYLLYIYISLKQIEIMEENKLIAEFMGYPELGTEGDFSYLKYHSSFDWLMPVHKKCMFTKQFIGDDQLRTLLIDAVIDADIDRLYKAVVEFIKEYSGDGFKTSSELAENC